MKLDKLQKLNPKILEMPTYRRLCCFWFMENGDKYLFGYLDDNGVVIEHKEKGEYQLSQFNSYQYIFTDKGDFINY